MKKIWITGAKGNIGSALAELLKGEYKLFLTDIDEVDITDIEGVKNFAKANKPDVIINCAAMTDVLKCEANVDEAYKVNALGARNVAVAAGEVGARIIQMSTDDVFNLTSEKPYNEFDAINPTTVYGKSKAAGEQMIEKLSNRFVIIRSSWIYGLGKDYVDEIIHGGEMGGQIAVPNNRFSCPTSARELSKVIAKLISGDKFGVYHVVCPQGCSKYEFAKTILEYAGLMDNIELVPIESDGKLRPNYSILDNMMLRISGIEEPKDWKSALKEYIDDLKQSV